jgi:hypothetical protein
MPNPDAMPRAPRSAWLLPAATLGMHTPVAVAAATLAAAALFAPLRRRIQHAADRRFNRDRYDADRTVAAFAARLKDAVDLDTIREELASVVQTTLEPASVRIWTARPPAMGRVRDNRILTVTAAADEP